VEKQKKNIVIEEFVGVFSSPGVYLMDFKGMTVAQITELRSKLREAHVSMKVVKNTLAKRALRGAGVENFDSYFIGPTGVVWSTEDSIIPVRVLLDYLKKNDKVKATVKAGLLDGSVVDGSQMEAVSKLPTKRELHAQVAAALNAPIVKLARTLNAVPSKFVRTVDALREQRSEG
jgi:large subunit ribosomal protein L10